MTNNFVPFQPNVNADGTANTVAGKDDAVLYGAVKPDPGGLPLGTLEYLDVLALLQRARARRSPPRCTCRRRRARSPPAPPR